MKAISFLFLFFLFSISAFAYETVYYTTENYNKDTTATGFWNSEVSGTENATFYTKTLQAGNQQPYVADVDNDGTKEIIVIDDDEIKLYTDNTLQVEDSYSLDISGRSLSNLVINNMDSDGYLEMVLYQGFYPSQSINIIQYNGSAWAKSFYNISALHRGNNDFWDSNLCCYGKECILQFYTGMQAGGYNTSYVMFNSTDAVRIYKDTGSSATSYIPSSPGCAVGDYDNDEVVEWIFSTALSNTGTVYLRIFSPDSDMIFPDPTSVIVETTGMGTSINENPVVWLRDYLTAPMIANIDGSEGNGDEIMVGYAKNPYTGNSAMYFKMAVISADNTVDEIYPNTLGATTNLQGNRISNLFKADFLSADGLDVCLLGYNNYSVDGQPINLLCVNQQAGFFDHDTWGLSYTPYNHSRTHVYGMLTHAVETDQSNGHSELLNQWGILALAADDTFYRIYDNPVPSSANIPIDLDGVGLFDILTLTKTNLWYQDDRFSKTNCAQQDCIVPGTVYTNPSINNVIKVNTTFEVRATLNEVDGDPLNAKLEIYIGDGNYQDSGWTTNASSGSTITWQNLEVNKTANNIQLKISVRDASDPLYNDTYEALFTVGLEGDEYGDSYFYSDDDEEEAAAAANNTVTNLMTDAANATGLNTTMLWFLLMVGIVVLGFYAVLTGSVDAIGRTMGLVLIGIAEFMMFILGALFGFISTAWVVTFAVLGIIGLGLFIGRMFIKSGP